MNPEQQKDFLRKLAKSSTGRQLIKYLEAKEMEFADIRNLGQQKPEVRIDALKMFRDSLLSKLLVLSGDVVPPNGDDWN